MKFLVALLIFLPSTAAFAQSPRVYFQFVPTFNGEPIELEKSYKTPTGDSIFFETLRFYYSDVSFYENDTLVFNSGFSPTLFDMTNPQRMAVPLSKHFNSIHFNLGIDSLTNMSGALGGDLDPTKGMYWTWQSGYINLKLEGKSNLCPTRNNAFEFHLGGYNGKQNALQPVSVYCEKTSEDIRIEIPLDDFLSQIDLHQQNQVMVPGAEAVSLAKLFAKTFRIQTP